jgi:hypothetical protein
MPNKKDNTEKQPEALSVRAFIKLLRDGKSLDDLDRLRVYDKDGNPVTQVKETGSELVIS